MFSPYRRTKCPLSASIQRALCKPRKSLRRIRIRQLAGMQGRHDPHVCARRGGPIQSAGGLQASNTFFCGNGMAFAMPFPVLSGFRFARSRGGP